MVLSLGAWWGWLCGVCFLYPAFSSCRAWERRIHCCHLSPCLEFPKITVTAQICEEVWMQWDNFIEVSPVNWSVLKGFFLFLANKLITREGPSFLQMRIKHLMKSNCIPQATCLSKLCADSPEIANVSSFRQAYITCVCSMLPNEDSIKEVSNLQSLFNIYLWSGLEFICVVLSTEAEEWNCCSRVT